jgi:hypothetical protein
MARRLLVIGGRVGSAMATDEPTTERRRRSQPRRRPPEGTRPPPREGALGREGPEDRDGALMRGADGRLMAGGAERSGPRGT